MSNEPLASKGCEWVVVAVGQQLFAIDIMSVREIRGWTNSTPLPQSPSFILGMINLRGAILPVVDLSARLGLGAANVQASSVVVVAQVDDREFGVLVDAVCAIQHIADDVIQQAPDVGSPEVGDFIRGLITAEEGIITLLSLDRIAPAMAQAA